MGESAAPGTAAFDYAASLACGEGDGDTPIDPVGGAVGVVSGADVVCTFTNSRKAADLTIAKVALQTSVEPGDIVVFRITVSNAADAGPAHDVIVTDPLPVGVTYEGSEDDRCEPDGTTCAVGDLGPGAA